MPTLRPVGSRGASSQLNGPKPFRLGGPGPRALALAAATKPLTPQGTSPPRQSERDQLPSKATSPARVVNQNSSVHRVANQLNSQLTLPRGNLIHSQSASNALMLQRQNGNRGNAPQPPVAMRRAPSPSPAVGRNPPPPPPTTPKPPLNQTARPQSGRKPSLTQRNSTSSLTSLPSSAGPPVPPPPNQHSRSPSFTGKPQVPTGAKPTVVESSTVSCLLLV
ncbi:unnamed protein product, partial [Cyprideis torosa]